jgi:hypothetical protein
MQDEAARYRRPQGNLGVPSGREHLGIEQPDNNFRIALRRRAEEP